MHMHIAFSPPQNSLCNPLPIWLKFLKTAESLTSVTVCHAGDSLFQSSLLLVRSKSYFYCINHPAGSQLKLCTTKKTLPRKPSWKTKKVFSFFFSAARASWICANINTFRRQKGGRWGGERQAQIPRCLEQKYSPFGCLNARLKQMSQMDIEPEDTWEWRMIALHINSMRTAFGP